NTPNNKIYTLSLHDALPIFNLSKESSVTTGKIYSAVIQKERHGDYLGATVQVIPHITDEIKLRLVDAANKSDADVIITEIGGTVDRKSTRLNSSHVKISYAV